MAGTGTLIILWLNFVDQSEPVAEPYTVEDHQQYLLSAGRAGGTDRPTDLSLSSRCRGGVFLMMMMKDV